MLTEVAYGKLLAQTNMKRHSMIVILYPILCVQWWHYWTDFIHGEQSFVCRVNTSGHSWICSYKTLLLFASLIWLPIFHRYLIKPIYPMQSCYLFLSRFFHNNTFPIVILCKIIQHNCINFCTSELSLYC